MNHVAIKPVWKDGLWGPSACLLDALGLVDSREILSDWSGCDMLSRVFLRAVSDSVRASSPWPMSSFNIPHSRSRSPFVHHLYTQPPIAPCHWVVVSLKCWNCVDKLETLSRLCRKHEIITITSQVLRNDFHHYLMVSYFPHSSNFLMKRSLTHLFEW